MPEVPNTSIMTVGAEHFKAHRVTQFHPIKGSWEAATPSPEEMLCQGGKE